MIVPSPHDHAHEGRSIAFNTPFSSQAASELVSRTVHEVAAKSAPRLLARYLGLRATDDDDDEMTEEECHPQPNINLCEKPAAATHIDIIVPVCIVAVLLVGLFSTLLYFHIRRKKRDEAEWSSKNNHEMEDYGIEPPKASRG